MKININLSVLFKTKFIYYFPDILDVTYISFKTTLIIHATLVLLRMFWKIQLFPYKVFSFLFKHGT